MKKRILAFFVSVAMIASIMVVSVSTASAASLVETKVYGNYETAGINIKVNNLTASTSATLQYKEQGTSTWKDGHRFVKYDGNHMATSIFNLKNDTTYDIKITIDGVQAATTTVKTKAEYALPEYATVVNVNNTATLNTAINTAGSNTIIQMAAGTYVGSFAAQNKKNLVITSLSNVKPVIQGRITFNNCDNVYLNNVEVTKSAGGPNNIVTIFESKNVSISNCFVHDAGDGLTTNYQGNIRIQGSSTKELGHNIINNIICDEVGNHRNKYNETCSDTYFGIKIGQSGEKVNNSYVTIRGNYIFNLDDGIHCGSDEKTEKIMGENDVDYLETRNNSQEFDFYDNVLFNLNDDGIETDGHMVNGRFFRNVIGNCVNAISVASQYPGPNFYVRNHISQFSENSIKHNTGIGGSHAQETTRNGFFYNNTIVQTDKSAGHGAFYRAMPGKNDRMTYVNNIFSSMSRVYDAAVGNEGVSVTTYTNESLDYNLLFSQRGTTTPFVKVPVSGGSATKIYASLAEYSADTGLETHSVNADPVLTYKSVYDTLPESVKACKYADKATNVYLFTIGAGSGAIDKAVVLPGINDNNISGAGPDIGANELGEEAVIPKVAPTIDVSPIPTTTPDPSQNVAKVTGLKVKNNAKKKTTISWKKVANASGYKIEMSKKKTKGYKVIKTLSASKAKFIKKNLKKGKTYYFRVRAYKKINGGTKYGAYSAVKKVKIKK